MTRADPSPDTSHEAQREVAGARDEVLGGRGPSASRDEVLSHTRGKIVQAGVPVVGRLAETARGAAHARSDGSDFVDGGLIADGRQAPHEWARAAGSQVVDAAKAGDVPAPHHRHAAEAVAATALVLLALLIGRRVGKPAEAASGRNIENR